jgi:tRNA nucleotidyltransferase (CCA-adding enzyme)
LRADEWVVSRLDDLRQARVGTPWERTQPADAHYLGVLTFRMSQAALEALITRLHVPGHEADILREVELLSRTRLPGLREPLRPSQIYRALAAISSQALLIAWLCSDDDTVRAQLAQFQRELRGVQPIIDGQYLRSGLHLRPGPIYRQVLDALRGARLDGQVTTLADEHRWVESWLKEHAEGQPRRESAAKSPCSPGPGGLPPHAVPPEAR